MAQSPMLVQESERRMASRRAEMPKAVAKMPRTRLSICVRKRRFASQSDAIGAALAADIELRPYVCDRCGQYHLTSRLKGKRRLAP